LKYLINIALLVIAVSAVAQKKKDDADTVRNKFMPTGIRVGADVISLIRSNVGDSFSGYEFAADVDFNRYFLVVEAGRWERDFASKTDQYSNEGRFMRVGADVNFLTKDPEQNVFFLGMRYGWGTFSEDAEITTIDPVWGSSTESYSNTDVRAGWFELTTGLRVKMWKYLWMGYTARYKSLLSTSGTGNLSSTDVPGYGATDKESTWGFNYYIFVRIPVRKIK
jgi:hypothetical protein